MKILKRFGPGLLALLALVVALDVARLAGLRHVPSFVTPAEAVVGRPLTPVSYAGVARRTARRCAAGVYYC
jgi:hypothetical protein